MKGGPHKVASLVRQKQSLCLFEICPEVAVWCESIIHVLDLKFCGKLLRVHVCARARLVVPLFTAPSMCVSGVEAP